MEKFKLELDVYVCVYMPQILASSPSLVTLKFSIHNLFKIRVLLKIFDAEIPYKLSYFEPLCLLAKMAAKTVKRLIKSCFVTTATFFLLAPFLQFWNLWLKFCLKLGDWAPEMIT